MPVGPHPSSPRLEDAEVQHAGQKGRQHAGCQYGGGVYAAAVPTEGVPNLHTIRSRAEDVGTPSGLDVTHRGARHR